MITKINYYLMFVFVFLLQVTFAQEQTKSLSGTVLDQNELPLPGVNITVQGTTQGTVTNFDGEFTIEVEVGQVLHFTSVGFQDQNWQVEEQDEDIEITMQEGTALDEVVVTALGITRDEKALGYSVQS